MTRIALHPEEEDRSTSSAEDAMSYEDIDADHDEGNSVVGSIFSHVSQVFQRRNYDRNIPESIDVIPEDDEDEGGASDHRYQEQPQNEEVHHSEPIRPEHQQIMRYDPQQHQLPAIHYHIYYTPDQQDKTAIAWKWIALVAIFSHLLYIYGGPRADGRIYRNELELEIPTGQTSGSKWWSFGYLNEHSVDTSTRSSCFSTGDLFQGDHYLSNLVFGQGMAIQEVKGGLQDHAAKKQERSRSPLVFLATGNSGTGKSTLAEFLASECDLTLQRFENIESWHLEGALQESASTDEHSLSRQLEDIVGLYPQGGVVWVLAMSSSLSTKEHLRMLLQLLSDRIREYPTYPWHDMIFYIESSVLGVPAIDKAIRHYGPHEIPVKDLTDYLSQQLLPQDDLGLVSMTYKAQRAARKDKRKEQQQEALMEYLQTNLPLEVSRILAFVPLTHDILEDIFQSILAEHGFIMADENRQDLLQQSLEWQTWIHKPTRTEILTTLANGGHDVNRLIRRILSPPLDLEEACRRSDDNARTRRLDVAISPSDLPRVRISTCGYYGDCDVVLCEYPLYGWNTNR